MTEPVVALTLPGTQPMSLQSVPPQQGVVWVRQAFALFMKHPIGFVGLFSANMLIILLVTLSLPLVGALFLIIATPWLSLGFMQASRQALGGHTPLVSMFLAPLRTTPSRVRPLLMLGLSYLGATLVLGLLAHWLDGGLLVELMEKSANNKEEAQQLLLNPQFHSALLLRFAFMVLLAIPFWHAPPLVAWGAQPVGRALVFSLVAMWRNKMAFMVFAMAWTAVGMMGVTFGVILGATGLSALGPVLGMIFFTVLSTVFYISTYFSFAACFWPQAGPASQ